MQDIAMKLPYYQELMSTSKSRKAVSSFVQYIMPYLKKESVKVTPAAFTQIADIAFAVSAAAENASSLELFRYFGLNESVHAG
jgi:ABC-type uncharacterized transport system substrate-binding protein